jgi:hypothetical protein
MIEGNELECFSDQGPLLVPLEKAGSLLGARVVVNQLGSVDVSLAKPLGPAAHKRLRN